MTGSKRQKSESDRRRRKRRQSKRSLRVKSRIPLRIAEGEKWRREAMDLKAEIEHPNIVA